MSKNRIDIEPRTGIQYKGYRDLKLQLMALDPHCYWCGKVVKDYGAREPGVTAPRNEATVDHLISRYHRKKGEVVPKVLSCLRCNQKRSQEEMHLNEVHKALLDRQSDPVL